MIRSHLEAKWAEAQAWVGSREHEDACVLLGLIAAAQHVEPLAVALAMLFVVPGQIFGLIAGRRMNMAILVATAGLSWGVLGGVVIMERLLPQPAWWKEHLSANAACAVAAPCPWGYRQAKPWQVGMPAPQAY
jgi:hypothetical protein